MSAPEKKIRIFRLVNRFNLGGITYNVSYLSKFLPAEYETLLAGGPEEANEASSLYIPRSLGLEPLLVKEMRRSIAPLQDYKAYKKIRKLIRAQKPHIVHTHASKAGAIGRLAAIHEKVPIIVHTFHGHVFHGYFGRITTAIYKRVEKYLARKSTVVIAISEIQKTELARKHRICNEKKIRVIPLGFDLAKFAEDHTEKREKFRSRYKLNTDVLAIGIIGRLAPIKNHGLFVEAVAACKKKAGRKVRGIIVGDGETREQIKKLIRLRGCTYTETEDADTDFVFTSWIKKVDEVLPGLDLVCLTSKNEGTPVSLIEAQAASRFVVSTDVGGIRDILHPDCGLLSPADDSELFVQNLLQAVAAFEKYSARAGAAAGEVAQKFGYTRLCNDMHRLYGELLQAGGTNAN